MGAALAGGGKSSRFFRDKSQLEVSGRQLVLSIMDAPLTFCRELFLMSNFQGKFDLPGVVELSDTYQNAVPLGVILAGPSAGRRRIS